MINKFSPLVSIIIPVYNGSDYLDQAIQSALNQTYKNIEIVVINDGSTDNGKTENIAKTFENSINYYYKKNGGVASALNFGIEKMKGEYFSWLSHDDKYYNTKISIQVEYLSKFKNKKVVLYSDLEYIDENSNLIKKLILPHYKPEQFRPAFIRGGLINGCTLLVHKICFKTCGIFNTNLRTTQDYDMWFRISEKYKFYHIPSILIYSRLHPEQDTKKLNKIVRKEKNEMYTNFLNKISNKEIKKFSNGNISSYYADYSREMYKAWFLKVKKQALRKAICNLPFSKLKNLNANLDLIIPLIGGRKAKLLNWLKSIFFLNKHK